MSARENFARMFGGAAGVSDAGANWQATPTHIFEPVRRVGEHHYGSPAMQSFLKEGLYKPDEAAAAEDEATTQNATRTSTTTTSPTRTETSTHAYTSGNVTVTGGAGPGHTSVNIYGSGSAPANHEGSMDPRSTFARVFPRNAGDFDAGAPTLARAAQTRAMSLAESTIQKSDVDQYGNPIGGRGAIDPTNTLNTPKPPEGESPAPAEAPSEKAGTSTTTMILLGGAAFVAVMLAMKGRKK